VNYSFRIFLLKHIRGNPSLLPPSSADTASYLKWRQPLLIVATSILIFLIYLNQDGLEKVLVVVGSLLTALGIILKLLETYKKQSN
jgi:hypothetical protein